MNQGHKFSHTSMVLQAAIHGQGIALANNVLAQPDIPDIDTGRLICPVDQVLVSKNSYYIVCREHQSEIGKISAFRQWMLNTVSGEQQEVGGQIL